MFLESSGNPDSAMQVIASLAPALAAGFAVQRLLEILDSWFAIFEKFTPERKRAVLSGISLVLGCLFAYRLDLRIIAVLTDSFFGNAGSRFFDYFVSGLIVSAGTDGFNSILKFLSYSKEVKKAEVETEEETVVSSRGVGRLPLFSKFSPSMTGGFQKTDDLIADLETALRDEIRLTWSSKFDAANWKKTPFKNYTNVADDPKIVVREATLLVAQAYNRSVTKDTRIRLQAQISLDTTPESIVPKMRTAILFGSV